MLAVNVSRIENASSIAINLAISLSTISLKYHNESMLNILSAGESSKINHSIIKKLSIFWLPIAASVLQEREDPIAKISHGVKSAVCIAVDCIPMD